MRRSSSFPLILSAALLCACGGGDVPESARLAAGDTLFARLTEATGGRDALASLRTVRAHYTATQHTAAGVHVVTSDLVVVAPNRAYRSSRDEDGQTTVVVDGDRVFYQPPGASAPTPADPDKRQTVRASLWHDLLFLLSPAGANAARRALGRTVTRGYPLDVLEIVPPDGVPPFQLDLHPNTHLPVQRRYEDGGIGVREILSDYREVGGLKVPFTVNAYVGDQPSWEIRYTRIDINVPVDDALFEVAGTGRGAIDASDRAVARRR